MKFLEFVSCCGPAVTSGPAVRPEPVRRQDETSSLVQQPRCRRRRKRGRLGGSGSASASSAEWKPTLCSISEDNVVIEKREENRTVGTVRLVKRKSGARSPRTNGASYNDDYGYVIYIQLINIYLCYVYKIYDY